MMAIPKRVVVQRRHSGHLDTEEELIVKAAKAIDVPVAEVNVKKLGRGHFPIYKTDLVVGGVQFMKHAFRLLGKELSEHAPYPECLQHLLYRKTRRISSLREAKQMLDAGQSFFIKPEGWKCFTGFVADSSHDFRFNGTSNQQPVIISDIVQFVSEWRAYVVDGWVRAIRWANAGDPTLEPDSAIIEKAVFDFHRAGSPAGYAIDFGVLSTGETALIEVNDGFSIGAYGDGLSTTYWDVLNARWQELIGGD